MITIDLLLPLLTSQDVENVRLGVEYSKQLSKEDISKLRKILKPIPMVSGSWRASNRIKPNWYESNVQPGMIFFDWIENDNAKIYL